jgi:hypothetical protein
MMRFEVAAYINREERLMSEMIRIQDQMEDYILLSIPLLRRIEIRITKLSIT